MASDASHPGAWPIAIIALISLVIIIILSIYFYRQILNNSPTAKKNPLSNKIAKISITAFTLYLLATIFNAVSATSWALGKDFVIWNVVSGIFYIIGLHLFLLVFVFRLDSLGSMDETGTVTFSLSYPKKVIHLFYGCVGVLAGWVFLVVIIYVTDLMRPEPLFAIWILLYAIVWIAMVVAFFRKIVPFIKFDLQSMKEYKKKNADSKIVIDVTPTCSLIRYSLLVLIAFLSTILNALSGVIFDVLTDAEDSWMVPVDSVINAICICLLFRFSTNIYYSLCCCDGCFAACFMRGVLKGADHNDKEIYQQLIHTQTRSHSTVSEMQITKEIEIADGKPTGTASNENQCPPV